MPRDGLNIRGRAGFARVGGSRSFGCQTDHHLALRPQCPMRCSQPGAFLARPGAGRRATDADEGMFLQARHAASVGATRSSLGGDQRQPSFPPLADSRPGGEGHGGGHWPETSKLHPPTRAAVAMLGKCANRHAAVAGLDAPGSCAVSVGRRQGVCRGAGRGSGLRI